MLLLSMLSAPHLVAQQGPAQFKADVKMKNADGTSATGVMYFGGAKMRTELTMDGQNIIVLADPAAQSQSVLMPDDKIYMQMPIGQGPISIPVSGPSDPTNPCSAGSGATDCVRGETESVNGYEAVRWDYTSRSGTRTRAWVSTKLRFPVKTEDDDGVSMELSKIVVGAQAASLFAVPPGYTKMDVGGMGGMTMANPGRGGAGRGRAGGNPIAGMGNLPPEMAAAMAAASRGQMPAKDAAPTGSPWEKGKGWVLNVTVTASGTEDTGIPNEMTHRPTRATYSLKYVGSIPLNLGSPAVGVPGAPGPWWITNAAAGAGSAEARAIPVTLSIDLVSHVERVWKGDCESIAGTEPGNSLATMKVSAQKSLPVSATSIEMQTNANFRIAADLKTYDLFVAQSMPVKEVVQKHTETQCPKGPLNKKDETLTQEAPHGPAFEFKGLPLPTEVRTITGTKKTPIKVGGAELDATVSWTLTPIR